ncbi:hypothetical protein C7974DRAFT_394261 [Boeremia exigua]|uniref:uncharacterized protein n=1 Tax=Boeremia exigua TaxID=749465 RepID=UPI001E8E3D91|nr:uncharacterized protein C7974DRAFT_394261 [Boeremia exigua]KAH6629325.1 hypothetical protein C7974DRAFT_394261 [Boeremia exigua]
MATRSPVWFVTTASSGLRKYMVLEHLSRGHRVIATAQSASKITNLAGHCHS